MARTGVAIGLDAEIETRGKPIRSRAARAEWVDTASQAGRQPAGGSFTTLAERIPGQASTASSAFAEGA